MTQEKRETNGTNESNLKGVYTKNVGICTRTRALTQTLNFRINSGDTHPHSKRVTKGPLGIYGLMSYKTEPENVN